MISDRAWTETARLTAVDTKMWFVSLKWLYDCARPFGWAHRSLCDG